MSKVKICGLVKCDRTVCRRPATIQTDEKGLICDRHYSGFRRREGIKRVEITCRIPNCTTSAQYWGVCNKHAQQISRYGKIRKRTVRDPNEIIIDGTVATIMLYDIQSNPVAKSLIDADMVKEIKKYKWHIHDNNDGYVSTSLISGSLKIHHLVMGKPPKGKEIDHINRNSLDNRRENLRFVTHQKNTTNRGIPSNNTSGVVGVGWDRTWSRWKACIRIEGKLINLGTFKKKKDAVKARKKAERFLDDGSSGN